MNHIKTFEELFPENHQRYISIFEKLKSSKIDMEINDIIEESLGISNDVINIVDDLVNQIKECINDGDYDNINYDYTPEIEIVSLPKPKIYNIEQVFIIGNFSFDTECILVDYNNISDELFEEVSVLNITANIRHISPNKFKLSCFIPTRNLFINDRGFGVLNHEIMHAWQHYNKNKDSKKEKDYPEWKKAYSESISILSKNNNDLIAKSIYFGDLRELASFTQQAYSELRKLNDDKEVNKKLKTLDLYKGMVSIKNSIDYLNNNDLDDNFASIINKNLLLKILNKRYYQYKKNISRIIIAIKETIEEGWEFLDINKIDGMYIK